jgi:hypothetical protein
LITATVKLWRSYYLSYDQARYITKEVRKRLGVRRVTVRKRVIRRLSQDEEQRLIQAAYHHEGERGLLLKTLFQTGALSPSGSSHALLSAAWACMGFGRAVQSWKQGYHS